MSQRTNEKHTEGNLHIRNTPIQLGDCELSQQLWSSGYRIAFLEAQNVGNEVARANAQRLVACWNATLGIATEDLESGAIGRLVGSVQDLRDEVDKYDLKATGNLRQVFAALAAFEKVSEKGRER
jgi:hypothetical protein